ncbi:MAG TPA: hypothetical protein PLU43_09285 [Lachnospiraceae bacterium]|nr:hypothetical protein [Lachnospiraceae bacterium]
MDDLKKQEVLRAITEADMVLVGIGKELEAADDHDSKQIADVCRTYEKLAVLLKEKNYFIITTNYDDKIYDSSINKDRIVAPCGSVHRFQCAKGCTDALYMEKRGSCPVCGALLCENTVKAENYIESGYLPQWNKYIKWLSGTLHKKLCVLELGVLMEFPSVIRWPFEKTVFLNETAFLFRINEQLPQLSVELKEKGMSIACHPILFFAE